MIVGLAMSLALAAAPPPARSATPLEVYGRLPGLENVALSPGGERIAFVRTEGDERLLTVYNLKNPGVLYGARVSNVKVRDLQWADEDHLLVTLSSTSLPPFGFSGARREWYQLVDVSVAKKKVTGVRLWVPDEETFNVIVSEPMVRTVGGKPTVFVAGLYVAAAETRPALFRYDLESGRTRIVSRSAALDTDWLVDDAGELAAELTYDDASKKWQLSARHDGRLQPVSAGTSALDPPSLLGFDATGASLLVHFVDGDRTLWRPWVLKDSAWGEPVDHAASFWHALADDRTSRIVGGSHGVDDDHYFFFDNELQAQWNAVLRAFAPDTRVDLVSASADHARMIVRVFGPKDGYRYALFDWYSHQTVSLAPVYPGLEQVAEVRKISYPAADGLSIPGYLTLPPGTAAGTVAGAQKLPLVVLPHGGPQAADRWEFDWWAQALANAGYAVLQPNYRGSTVSHEHLSAGFGEWGRKMQTDLSDGVRYLADQGLIDPGRVCIVGGSYGGYAALAGMTLQPGIYRCGVSVAGVADLRDMMLWEADNAGRRNNYTQRYWDRFMNVAGPDDPKLQEISPIEHVSATQGPVLLVHGQDDTVVPYRQSERMQRALRKAGKSVDFVTLKHEDHWLSSGDTRLQMLQAVVDFLKANNPPTIH